jgi:hypothetical protein
MADYVADPGSGAPTCTDCAVGACVSVAGWHCQAEACRCGCRPDPDRAADFIPGFIPQQPDPDDRHPDKLAVIAAELAAERTGNLRDLQAERYQGGGR